MTAFYMVFSAFLRQTKPPLWLLRRGWESDLGPDDCGGAADLAIRRGATEMRRRNIL